MQTNAILRNLMLTKAPTRFKVVFSFSPVIVYGEPKLHTFCAAAVFILMPSIVKQYQPFCAFMKC